MTKIGKNVENSKIYKRNYAKYISRSLAITLRNSNEKSPLRQSYLNTYYCNHNLYVDDNNNLTGKYCKHRWCILCNRIRTAELINGYLPTIMEMKDKYFVTLTLPTCNGKYLPTRIKEMEEAWRRIMKLNREAKYFNLNGIRKMECTIRPQGMYHYHYHIIVDGKEQAEWILSQWLKRFNSANKMAQDIRKADDKSVKELFKYFTKLLAKDDGLFKSNDREIKEFKRLDFIFCKIQGKRIFQPFGNIRKISEDIIEIKSTIQRPQGLEGEIWKWVEYTWVSELGELLTNYKPSETTKLLLKNCND